MIISGNYSKITDPLFNIHFKKDETFKLEDIKNSLPEIMTSFKINRVI